MMTSDRVRQSNSALWNAIKVGITFRASTNYVRQKLAHFESMRVAGLATTILASVFLPSCGQKQNETASGTASLCGTNDNIIPVIATHYETQLAVDGIAARALGHEYRARLDFIRTESVDKDGRGAACSGVLRSIEYDNAYNKEHNIERHSINYNVTYEVVKTDDGRLLVRNIKSPRLG